MRHLHAPCHAIVADDAADYTGTGAGYAGGTGGF